MKIDVFAMVIYMIVPIMVFSCKKNETGFDWDKYKPNDTTANSSSIMDMQKVFSFSPQHRYAYCPSIIEDNNIQHVFFCGNPNENDFIDNIYHMTIDRQGNTTIPKSVLQPTNITGFWDDRHTCDPSVVAGNFGYKGNTYSYAMFFLGNSKKYYYNEIGVAFSNSLNADSWVKFDTVFIKKPWSTPGDQQVGTSKSWGIGQPDAITLNPENGDILLTYTRGDNEGSRLVYRLIKGMKNVETLEMGPEIVVNSNGVNKYKTNSPDYLRNAVLALDKTKNQFVMIRPMSPFATSYPAFIASYLEVTTISTDGFYKNTGKWNSIAQISPSDTKYPRNHNAGLVRDKYGSMIGSTDSTEIYFTTCLEEPAVENAFGKFAEWTYTIWRAKLKPH